MEGFSWIMIFGRKSDYFWFFYLNLTKHKLLLGIRSSWTGKVDENCSSVSGMRLKMSSKQVFQVSLMSMPNFLGNEIMGKTAEEQRRSRIIFCALESLWAKVLIYLNL
jgi:hypothetical protein